MKKRIAFMLLGSVLILGMPVHTIAGAEAESGLVQPEKQPATATPADSSSSDGSASSQPTPPTNTTNPTKPPLVDEDSNTPAPPLPTPPAPPVDGTQDGAGSGTTTEPTVPTLPSEPEDKVTEPATTPDKPTVPIDLNIAQYVPKPPSSADNRVLDSSRASASSVDVNSANIGASAADPIRSNTASTVNDGASRSRGNDKKITLGNPPVLAGATIGVSRNQPRGIGTRRTTEVSGAQTPNVTVSAKAAEVPTRLPETGMQQTPWFVVGCVVTVVGLLLTTWQRRNAVR